MTAHPIGSTDIGHRGGKMTYLLQFSVEIFPHEQFHFSSCLDVTMKLKT